LLKSGEQKRLTDQAKGGTEQGVGEYASGMIDDTAGKDSRPSAVDHRDSKDKRTAHYCAVEASQKSHNERGQKHVSYK
jgi:hypothetical protein